MNLRNKLTLANANPNESTPLSRAIFFIIIGVAFYLLDRFNLFYLDDCQYAYKFGTYDPIRTLKDIFESQCDHYTAVTNGNTVFKGDTIHIPSGGKSASSPDGAAVTHRS